MAADTRVAEWMADAKEITPEEARGQLGIEEVCRLTGLRQITLQFAMNRTGRLKSDAPKSHLLRPAYHTGEIPFWDRTQVDAYHRAVREQIESRKTRWDSLPILTAEDAAERKLLTLRAIQRATGYALTTLHRWSNQEGFPEPVARGQSKGPNPHLLREWATVRDWLRNRNPDRDIPDDPPVD